MKNTLKPNVIEGDIQGKTLHCITFMPKGLIMKYGLPSKLIIGTIENPGLQKGSIESTLLKSFKENSEFKCLLHHFISEVLSAQSELKEEAELQDDGWLYVIDQRTPDPGGNIPPADIIGGFRVQSGNIKEYKPNPNYKTYTSDGFLDLGENNSRIFYNYMKKHLCQSNGTY